MKCPHCQFEHSKYDDDNLALSRLICPFCHKAYNKQPINPESLAKIRENIAKKQVELVRQDKLDADQNKRSADASYKAEIVAKLKRDSLKFATAIVVIIFLGFMIKRDTNNFKPSNDSETKREMASLFLCQQTIIQLSRDPETASVPYVPNMGTGGEYYFAWGTSTKMVRMHNGLGLEVAASASCIVDKTSQTITSLTFNGKTII